MFPGPKKNAGNARGTDRNRRVYDFPSSRPHSLLHIAPKQANKHLFLLSYFHSSCKSIYSISPLTPLFLLFSSESFSHPLAENKCISSFLPFFFSSCSLAFIFFFLVSFLLFIILV